MYSFLNKIHTSTIDLTSQSLYYPFTLLLLPWLLSSMVFHSRASRMEVTVRDLRPY